MGDNIKCSYEECYKRFKSEEAMKKHKVKDPDHFYCKRCDVDCDDDTEYLIHQIISPRHIVCPTCGAEFEGSSARDLHVEVRHKKQQTLECVGCGEKLRGAAAYMAHISKGECEVITLETFDRLRAERQIQKDAWDEALNTTTSVIYGDRLNPKSSTSGSALLDDDLPETSDQQLSGLDSTISPLQPTKSNLKSVDKLLASVANISLNSSFPPLPPQSQQSASQNETVVSGNTTVPDGDLLEFSKADVESSAAQQKVGAWSSATTSSSKLFPPKPVDYNKAYPSQSDLSYASAETTRTAATYGANTNLNGHSNIAAGARQFTSDPVPAAGKPIDNDPNAPFRGVQTATLVTPQSTIDPMNYYDDIQHKFICTGKDCRREFDTAEGFKAHLVSGAHVGGQTQCPSCLKKFNTTWALIAHCESPSRKCRISKSANYNQILRELTAGLLGTEGHTEDGTGDVRYVANPVDEWVKPSDRDPGCW